MGPSDEENTIVCMDGSKCNVLIDGWDCCVTKGGIGKCPPGRPILCEKSCGNRQSRCCVLIHDYCDDTRYALGGIRLCNSLDPARNNF